MCIRDRDSITALQTLNKSTSEFSNRRKIVPGRPPRETDIHRALSPNNDGLNDYFVIDYLDQEEYQNSRLTIFNKWGTQIIDAKNYQDKVPWNGAKSWNGEENEANDYVLPGTYYYVLTTNYTFEGEKKEYREVGFIEVRY